MQLSILLILLVKTKKGSQLKNIFITILSLLIFWFIFLILQLILCDKFNINPIVFENFIYISACLIPVLILLLSKLNKNNKIIGLGCIGICGCCSAASAYCLNTFCGCYIMYCLCIGSIFAIISCYYKIKGIKEIEKKKEINDIELEDVDKE